MRTIGYVVLCVLVLAGVACADTATVTLTVTNGQTITFSDPITASGYLDKIEVVASDGTAHTSTVTIATYSGTTAMETFGTLSAWSAGTKVIRPRVLPTDNTGTALAASASATTNATIQLSVPYAQPLIGGNLKMAVTGTANTGSNTVTATLYYEPLKK